MGQHGASDHKLDDGPEAELRGLKHASYSRDGSAFFFFFSIFLVFFNCFFPLFHGCM